MGDASQIKNIINALQEKYDNLDQDLDDHLYGLLYSKPITYWDYIQTDALLNLQVQRTTQPDEMVFIAYHQINELIFKMILWEIAQVAENKTLNVTFFESKIMRISRYFDMLTTSFNINLLRPANEGKITAVGKVRYKSKTLFTAESTLYNEAGKEIAFGTGNFAKSKMPLTEEIGYK